MHIETFEDPSEDLDFYVVMRSKLVAANHTGALPFKQTPSIG